MLTLRLQPEAGLARLQAGLGEARACRDISVLIGHCSIARLEGHSGQFAKAFAELAEAERLMHIWDVPPIYYLAMITLVKCELWLAQGRTDLAEAWLARLGQTYNGKQAAAPPEFHPQLPLHIELQQALLDVIQGQSAVAEQRLNKLIEHGQQTGRQLLCVMALSQKVALLLGSGREPEARQALAQAFEAAGEAYCNLSSGCLATIPTGCESNFSPVRNLSCARACLSVYQRPSLWSGSRSSRSITPKASVPANWRSCN